MSSTIRQRVLYAQNFLKDPHLIASLLDKLAIERSALVYEIGAGRGIITEQLALRYQQVIAIEKDPRLASLLRQKFATRSNVTIHAGDFLCAPLPRRIYQVFANIPFNITTAIVTRLTAAERAPEDAYLVMQKEAAEMFLGKPRESLSTLLLKLSFEMEVLHQFQRADFRPAPHVDVVLLHMHKRGSPLVRRAERQCFRDFVVHIFTSRQSTIGATLKSIFTGPQLKHIKRALSIDLNETPTSVPFSQWLTLFAYFKAVGSERAMQGIVGSEKSLIAQQSRLLKRDRTHSVR